MMRWESKHLSPYLDSQIYITCIREYQISGSIFCACTQQKLVLQVTGLHSNGNVTGRRASRIMGTFDKLERKVCIQHRIRVFCIRTVLDCMESIKR